MKEITNSPSGNVSANINGGVLIPSFNSGAVTATQSGKIITVTCVNDHKMSVWYNHGITNNNNRIYLRFNVGAFATTGLYSNLKVLTSKVFTCESTVTQTVLTPATVQPFGTTVRTIPEISVPIPAKTLKAGSSIRLEAYITFPSNTNAPSNPDASASGFDVSARSFNIGLGTSGLPYTFLNTTTDAWWYNSYLLYCMITFLSDTDFISTKSGDVQGSPVKTITSNSTLNLQTGFSICPTINFGSSATNDYQLWNIVRTEIVI